MCVRRRRRRFDRGRSDGDYQVKSGPLLRISDDMYIPGLRELTQTVHATSGSKIVPQVIHFLKVARTGWRQTADMLSLDDIDQIVEQFGDAVRRAREAGFDGAELHSAHAYTLSSFLHAQTRTPTNTAAEASRGIYHLIGRVIESVRRKAGRDFPLGVRFNAEEFIKDGYTVVDSKRITVGSPSSASTISRSRPAASSRMRCTRRGKSCSPTAATRAIAACLGTGCRARCMRASPPR